jgi:hypothetical protein
VPTERYDVVLVRIDSTGHLWDSYGPFQDDWPQARASLEERTPHDWTVEATFIRPLSEVLDGSRS